MNSRYKLNLEPISEVLPLSFWRNDVPCGFIYHSKTTECTRSTILGFTKWVIAFFILVLPMSAVAQQHRHEKVSTNANEESKEAEAEKLYKQAQVSYNLGRFKEAIERYSKAYEISRLPGFLFNIGQCYRELKEYDQAIFFFQGYLRENPNSTNRKLVEELISESETKSKEQKKRKNLVKSNGQVDLSLGAAHGGKGKRLPSTGQSDSSTAFYQEWWFWTIVGGAVALATGGVVLAMSSGETGERPSGSLGTLDFRGL